MGDCFLTEINSGGAALTYSTFVGGTLDDAAGAIAFDQSGVTSGDGPTLTSLRQKHGYWVCFPLMEVSDLVALLEASERIRRSA